MRHPGRGRVAGKPWLPPTGTEQAREPLLTMVRYTSMPAQEIPCKCTDVIATGRVRDRRFLIVQTVVIDCSGGGRWSSALRPRCGADSSGES